MEEHIAKLERALLEIDRVDVGKIVAGLKKDFSPVEIAEDFFVPALERIGSGWEKGRVSLSQVYMSGRICEELMNAILPRDSRSRIREPRIAVAVLEDRHMLGKRIVSTVLRSEGFDPLDYGTIGVEELVSRVKVDKVQILMISTLMLHSALRIGEVSEKLKTNGNFIKIVVGGAPFRFDDTLWQQVHADAMGKYASQAITIVKEISGGDS